MALMVAAGDVRRRDHDGIGRGALAVLTAVTEGARLFPGHGHARLDAGGIKSGFDHDLLSRQTQLPQPWEGRAILAGSGRNRLLKSTKQAGQLFALAAFSAFFV